MFEVLYSENKDQKEIDETRCRVRRMKIHEISTDTKTRWTDSVSVITVETIDVTANDELMDTNNVITFTSLMTMTSEVDE